MDELDIFRGFRSGVAAPSADAERRAALRLTDAIEGGQGWGARVLCAVRRRPGRTTLALALVAGAAAAALFVSAPWKTSPGFLEQVQAAVTPPEGWILHVKWKDTLTSTDPACSVTRPHELWIDQKSLQYRILLHNPRARDTHAYVCVRGTRTELGGVSGSGMTFEFVPPNSIRPWTGHGEPFIDRDPMAGLRDAIREGRAHEDGTTRLDGRTVQRIRFQVGRCPQDVPASLCSRKPEPIYAYVDPETHYPVRVVAPQNFVGPPIVWFRWEIRYLKYEYLPRTAENLALTDIRAQHPDATGP